MNDVDRWIYFDGPVPASVQPLLDALREVDSPRPTPEQQARALAGFFEALDAKLAGGAAAAPAQGEGRAPEALRETAESVELSAAVREAMGKLPFVAAPPATSGTVQGAVKTMPVPVIRSTLGETLPLDSDAIHKAIAVMPFAASTGGAGVVAFPALTAQQYVSLRADLACRPDRAAETLRIYGVPSAASWRALEEHWQEQLAKRADLRTELDAAVATFASWLRGPASAWASQRGK